MMSGKRWGYVVQFFCLLVFLGMSPFLIKMDGRKTMSVSSDSVRSQNVSDEVKPVVALTFDDDVIIGLSQEISYKEAVSMI